MLIESFVGKKVLIEPDVAKRVLLEPIACPALTRWFIFRDSEKSDQPYILLWQPATFFFNLFVLVPLGCIFRTKAVPVGKSIIVAILIVLVCESLQYVFKLGIFDVIDIVSNVIGFIFGFYLADALIEFGLQFRVVSEHVCSLTRKNNIQDAFKLYYAYLQKSSVLPGTSCIRGVLRRIGSMLPIQRILIRV